MPITWSNAARHDVARIFDFNAAYDLQRAGKIDGRLAEGAERCLRNPLAGRPVTASIRERSLRDIQYVVRYRIDAADEITILRIRHRREHRDVS